MQLTVQDRLDILELAARYSWAADCGDAKAYSETFTIDGEVHGKATSEDAEMGSLQTLAKGREEIKGAFFDAFYNTQAGGHHHTHNHVIEVFEGTVRHRSFWSFVKPVDGLLKTIGMGTYEDELRHDPEQGWLFHRREIIATGVSS